MKCSVIPRITSESYKYYHINVKEKEKKEKKKRPYIELQDSYTDMERNINKKGQKYRGKVTYAIYHSKCCAYRGRTISGVTEILLAHIFFKTSAHLYFKVIIFSSGLINNTKSSRNIQTYIFQQKMQGQIGISSQKITWSWRPSGSTKAK